ncbi:MAG: 2,3-phosphoglycerate synthetase [Thermoleophilia bacterium]
MRSPIPAMTSTSTGSSPTPERRPAAVALIDGEHYPAVVADALRELGERYEFRAAVFLGGTEKIRGDDLEAEARRLYGLPVIFAAEPAAALVKAIEEHGPDVVVDVSDEPVVGYRERFRLISFALSRNVSYEGSDFRFTPPRLDRLSASPSLSIIGTAKRVGKTALSGYVARIIQEASGYGSTGAPGVVIVPMGRGGPARPEIIDGLERVLGAADLLAWSRQGRHAASDHFEDAALSRVTTVGCRRCGGGMAGQPFVSNVAAGAILANGLGARLTIFEGSGAAMPPVATDARLLVAGAHQPPEYVTGYLGTYRVLVSDAMVLTMAEEPLAERATVERILREVEELRPGMPAIPVVFRPFPVEPVEGRRVALFSTAPPVQAPRLRRHLEERHGCEVVAFSGNLSNRRALVRDLENPALHGAEMYLTEIKAAAIDVVAEAADERGLPVVFVDNLPMEVAPAQEGALAELCRWLAGVARERHESTR